MLRIRLRRTGAKKKPNYRVVVADARAPRDGSFIDILGYYNPLTDPSTVVIDAEKAQHWLSRGAQPSDRVARLLQREGIVNAAGTEGAATATGEPEPAPAAPAGRTRRSSAAGTATSAEAAPTAVAETPETPTE